VAKRKEERKKREGTSQQKWKDKEAKKKAAGVAARPERGSKSLSVKNRNLNMVVSAGMGNKTVKQDTLIHSSNTEYLFYFRTKFSLSHPSVLAATHHGRVELDDKAGTSSLKAEWVVTAIRLMLWGDMEGSLKSVPIPSGHRYSTLSPRHYIRLTVSVFTVSRGH
jgi:hypothetical protein